MSQKYFVHLDPVMDVTLENVDRVVEKEGAAYFYPPEGEELIYDIVELDGSEGESGTTTDFSCSIGERDTVEKL